MGMQQQQQQLHRKKWRIGRILVNALVEWILISLLLLNSLFTYLITKYAHFFGLNLKPPNTTISLSHNHNHCTLPTPNSQHILCQLHYCSIQKQDIIPSEEEECSKEDAHNEDDSLHLQTTHCCTNSLPPVPLHLIDSFIFRDQRTLTSLHLFQQHTHLQFPHPSTKEHQLHKDQEETPLQLEADGESIQVKPLSYRDDCHSANGEQEARENEPQTPTSLDSLHNKLLLLSEKRDSSSTSIEESLDGSIDKGVTVERLKSALTSERKTLRAVYAELEEERSASAIAANHTMAMITRLQEEKAAMQMEALQYQRMMEEQAEYDQEALQLLNQLMLNKEKEKDELSKELEMYRENHNILIEGEHTDDDDDDDDTRLSIDLNRAMIEKHNDSDDDDDDDLEVMALDCMKHMSELDESLAEFEEEKLSILDQLKALEEKLLMMSGEGSEGRVEDNDIEHVQKETMQSMAKQLLPLLDEAEDDESAEIELNHLVERFPDDDDEKEAKKVDGLEEVDRVYERLKALEELENVKEDKQGMNHHLLQEILQNLQDLKTVELQVQGTGIA